MQSEKGRVAMMRRMETRAKSRAQQPGPSGSAGKEKNELLNELLNINSVIVFSLLESLSCFNIYLEIQGVQ